MAQKVRVLSKKSIALVTACLFCNPCAHAELHQQKRARKLCSGTLMLLEFTLSVSTRAMIGQFSQPVLYCTAR